MSDRKVICLGMPSYGQLTSGAAMGLYRSSGRATHDLRLLHCESSLLAMNMNRLWTWALNTSHNGKCDYFAMLHADIEPEEFWLDKLIDELEATGLDVLGVAAPIKDQRGLTSIAMGRDDGDIWKVHGRLTMTEIYKLPPTFTSADIGRQLLINTGCWVCKFDESWARQVHFTINDRICYDPKREMYFPQNEPEDWFVSRLFHELGLKIGCTRKVQLGHRGVACFGNLKPWGTEQFDPEYLKASVLDSGDKSDWFPHYVAGWMTEGEGRKLAELADGKVVLEIGSYCGRSTICLAQKARSVGAVDTFDGRGTALPGDTLALFNRNMGKAGVSQRVNVLQGTSEEILPNLPPVFDLIFIDGSHDRESVARDVELSLPLLRPNGILVFHDYNGADLDVTAVIDETLADGAELLEVCESLAVVKPTEAQRTKLTPVQAGSL